MDHTKNVIHAVSDALYTPGVFVGLTRDGAIATVLVPFVGVFLCVSNMCKSLFHAWLLLEHDGRVNPTLVG